MTNQTDLQDLIRRLRKSSVLHEDGQIIDALLDEAADALEALMPKPVRISVIEGGTLPESLEGPKEPYWPVNAEAKEVKRVPEDLQATPRVDAHVSYWSEGYDHPSVQVVGYEFAKELERELNQKTAEAKAYQVDLRRIEEMYEALKKDRNAWKETAAQDAKRRDEFSEENVVLTEQIEALKKENEGLKRIHDASIKFLPDANEEIATLKQEIKMLKKERDLYAADAKSINEIFEKIISTDPDGLAEIVKTARIERAGKKS